MYRVAAEFIKDRIERIPEIGLVLGSGLGSLADSIEDPTFIQYKDIPGFPETTVPGHIGRFVVGEYRGKNVIAMQGRFHYYEGREMEQIVLPIRVMRILGVKILVVTNAAGGINPDFSAGDLMMIEDHINFLGLNPLRGSNLDELGPRFPDMTYAYDPFLRKKLMEIAQELGIPLRKGVYAMMPGPSYETPAEIKMLKAMGADAVGMSTVPEVIAAVHAGMKVVGISCITNMAAGVLDKPLNHLEVMETAERSKDQFMSLLSNFIASL